MPRFSEQYISLQEATVPTAGPVPATITIGFWFRLLEPCQFVGWRFYTAITEHGGLHGTLWDSDATTLLAIGQASLKQYVTPALASGWRNFYAHPRAHLLADHFYLLSVATDGNGVFRTPDVFQTSDVNNLIISAPQHIPGTTNPNGVFIEQLTFNNPPSTSSGHLYGIDMLLLV